MIEQDTRYIIDSNLSNKGWILDINNPKKNVFFETDILRIIDNPKLKKSKLKPDYVLIDSNKNPIGVIEAKAGGKDLEKATEQAMEYAEILNAPLIFAMNSGYCQTKHLYTNKPLYINENEVNELIRETEALKFLQENSNEIYTLPKQVILSRQELISFFSRINDSLREEGLRAGDERLTEFANILFLKLYTENSNTNLWNSIKILDNELLIDSINIALKKIEADYNVDNAIFQDIKIKNPQTLKEIIDKLDKLTLSTIDTDIKGDAFEYFLQQSTTADNDLGEYFTPRHITKTLVNLVNPKFKEKIYDPFCGTGGFLTESFNHIKNNTIIDTEEDKNILASKTIFGGEITNNARLAKMNMILHGDGHSGIKEINSLANPIDNEYDIVISNIPFSQKTKFSHLYYNGLAKNSGDGVCLLHMFRAVKKGGRIAVIVPEGILFRKTESKVRKYLLENAKLQTVISLPQGVFLPYTGVKTNIIYFTNVWEKTTSDKIWYFEVKSDGFSLNNHRKKIIDNDLKKVDFIDLIKKQDAESLLEIGFKEIDVNKIKENKYNLLANFYQKQELNDTFKIVKLGDVIEFESGARPKGGVSNIACGALSLGGEQIQDGKINLDKVKYVPFEYYTNATKGKVKNNDILMCKDGALTGKVGFVYTHLLPIKDVMINEHVYIIRANEDIILQKYLYFILQRKNIYTYIQKISQKSAQPGLNNNGLKSTEIPLLPLEEQEKIVNEIDVYQNIIDSAKNIVDNYQPYFEIDNKWEKITLGSLCDIVRGGSPRPIDSYLTNDTEGLNWLKIGDVDKNAKYVTDTKNKIKKEGLKHTRLAKKGTFILF